MCHANKLPLFSGVFSTPPPVSPYHLITTVHVQRTLHIRWLRIRSTGTQVRVRGKPHFHNALTIVRVTPDWPTLVLMKESLPVCHANRLPLFAGVFSTPRQSSRTIAALPYMFNVHYTFGGYALEAQVRRYATSTTFVQAAPDWPTLVLRASLPASGYTEIPTRLPRPWYQPTRESYNTGIIRLPATDANVRIARHSANDVNGVLTRRRMVSSRFASDYMGGQLGHRSDRLILCQGSRMLGQSRSHFDLNRNIFPTTIHNVNTSNPSKVH